MIDRKNAIFLSKSMKLKRKQFNELEHLHKKKSKILINFNKTKCNN